MARFVARCAMRWSDMDAYGHVNNTAYLAYLEQARVAMFFDRKESSFAKGTLVAHHEITYLRPVVYHPEPLRLELWIEEVRGASFRVRYEVFDGPTMVATASTSLVTFDFDTDRPRRLTADERLFLISHADDGAPTSAGEEPSVITDTPVDVTGAGSPLAPGAGSPVGSGSAPPGAGEPDG